MNKQLHLFTLINSMTKSEKRYFKLFNSTFEGKNKTNLKLFNAIDKQKTYDEKALKELFADEPFVKHFAVVKSNLFNSILKSLRIYNENLDVHKKLNQYNENFRILSKKGLLDIAKIQLDKGMKLATEYDVIEAKLLIAGRYNSLNSYFEFRNNKNKDVQKIFSKPLEHLEDLNERYKYKYISKQIDFLVLQNSLRSEKTQSEIIRILQIPEMQENCIPISLKSAHSKYHILLSCYIGQKDYSKALPASKKIVDLILDNPKYNKTEPFNILNDYNNYLHTAVRIASYNEIEDIMQDYLAAIDNAKNLSLADSDERIFEIKYFYKLEYYILNKKFEEAVNIMPTVESELIKIEDKVCSYMHTHFSYNFAYLYFMFGDYLKSQEYVVKLINSSKLKIRIDYSATIHLLKLFIHFELGNFDHLICELKNVRELLKRKEYLFEFEKQAIGLLQKLSTHPQQNERIEIYKHYKIVFEELSKLVENRDAFEKLDILFWINGKLKKLTDTFNKKLLLETLTR